MEATLEFSLRYARKGIEAILDARPALGEDLKIIVTSTNTINFIQPEDSEYEDIREDECIRCILQPAGIPDGEYWWS